MSETATTTVGIEWWPVARVTTDPPGPYVSVLREHYWITDGDGRVAVYRSRNGHIAPQCNTHRSIPERMAARTPGATGVVFLPLAFAPIRIEDYR